jgi:S1-C subfamily serine protease
MPPKFFLWNNVQNRLPEEGRDKEEEMRIRVLIMLAVLLFASPALAKKGGGLSDVFERVRNAVVVIHTTEQVPVAGKLTMAAKGLGSGVLISKNGDVLTAAHVVQSAESVVVEFPDGKMVNASIVASAPAADIALLNLNEMPEGVVVAGLSDSDEVRIGEDIFIVGAPYGLSHTLTVGHISARREENTLTGPFMLAEFFQTDAAVNQGNSGGPMFNMKGEVIGVVSYILSQSGGFEGLGFVVTSNTARELLMEQKSPWTGIDGVILAGELARALNLPQKLGVLVQRVAAGSPGERAGLQGGSVPATVKGKDMLLGGDIILGVGDISLAEPGSILKIRKMINELPAGTRVPLKVLREGREAAGLSLEVRW